MNRFLSALLALVLPLLLATGAHAMATLPLPSEDAAVAFERWLDMAPARRAEVSAFESFLSEQRVMGVLPTREILLTDTDWSVCRSSSAFILPARADWPHIVNTLRYVRDEIVPQIGPVQVISGYRDKKLNRCVDGARHSAHADFYAFDLMPVRKLARSELVAQICTRHSRNGAAYNAGLGIYEGTKFHIDTRSFRRWGSDYRSSSSPCARYENIASKRERKQARVQVATVKPTGVPRLRLAMLVD